LTTFVFPRAFSGQQAPICALRSPALGLTLLSQQEEVWREHGGEKWQDMVYFKGNLNKTEKTQNPAACAINEAHSWFFTRNSQLQPWCLTFGKGQCLAVVPGKTAGTVPSGPTHPST